MEITNVAVDNIRNSIWRGNRGSDGAISIYRTMDLHYPISLKKVLNDAYKKSFFHDLYLVLTSPI